MIQPDRIKEISKRVKRAAFAAGPVAGALFIASCGPAPVMTFEAKDYRVESDSQRPNKVLVIAKHELALRRGLGVVRVFCGSDNEEPQGERRRIVYTQKENCPKVLLSKLPQSVE